MLGEMDLILIGGAVLLFFGPAKIHELMKGLGKGMREFKRAQSDLESEIKKVMDPPEVKATKNEQEELSREINF